MLVEEVGALVVGDSSLWIQFVFNGVVSILSVRSYEKRQLS